MERHTELQLNARYFLQARGLDGEAVRRAVLEQFPDCQDILLTSSPVQGLATPTSDVDFIAVVSGELSEQRMATQLYLNGCHCEIVALTRQELDAALQELVELSANDAVTIARGSRNWNIGLSRKYLERTVHGVSLDDDVPNLTFLPELARVWSIDAARRFVESVTSLHLSLAAGETRAPVVYALSAVLDGMDAVLCRAGYVFSNRKWIPSRWEQHAAAATLKSPAGLGPEALDELLAAVRARLGRDLGALTARIDRLEHDLLAWLFPGETDRGVRLPLRQGVRLVPFGKGAQVALGHGKAVLAGDAAVDPSIFDRRSLAVLRSSEAGRLLDLLRRGLLDVEMAGSR